MKGGGGDGHGKLDVSKGAWDLPKDVVFGVERSMSVSGPTLTNMIREQVCSPAFTRMFLCKQPFVAVPESVVAELETFARAQRSN